MRASATPFSRLGQGLIALALLLRVLIPAGYMPSVGRAGSLPTLVICTGHGAISVPIKDAGKGGDSTPSSAGEHGCPFASAAVPPLSDAELALFQPLAWAAHSRAMTEGAPVPGRGLAAPPPPATGPPSIV